MTSPPHLILKLLPSDLRVEKTISLVEDGLRGRTATYYHPSGHEGYWIDDNTFYAPTAEQDGQKTGAYFRLDSALAAGDEGQDWYTNDPTTVYGKPAGLIDPGEFIDRATRISNSSQTQTLQQLQTRSPTHQASMATSP